MKLSIGTRMAATALLGWLLLASPNLGADSFDKVRLPDYKKVTLQNGMTLFLMERHQLPLVSYHWMMKSAGSIADPGGQEGLALITANLLRKGTQSRTSAQISDALDFVGATLGVEAAQEFSAGAAEFLKKDLNLSVDLIADLLLHPVFPQAEVDKIIKQRIDAIKEAKAVPQRVIQFYFDALLFGPHPYGRPAEGTETSLARLQRESIVKFYESRYVPNQMILVVVGDFSGSEMESRLKEKFEGWASREVVQPSMKAAVKVRGRHLLMVDKPDATQTFFRIGNVGVARTSPDWIPIQVVNTLFGGRFTSMINTALRIESGLTYGAGSVFSARRLPGSFIIGSFTPNESTEHALDLALNVLKTLHAKGISEEQLKSAKAYIKGQFGPTIETNDQLAAAISELEFYGLDASYINTYFDKIDAVSIGDAQRIVETYYPSSDLVFVLIGKGSVIEPLAKKLATDVKRKSISDPGF